MKDELRTDGDPIAWQAWRTAQNQLWQLRQPAPPLEFPGEQGMFIDMYAQVRAEGGFHEVTALSPSFNEALLSEFLPTYLSGSQGSLLEGFGPWCQLGSRVTPCVACCP